MRARTSQRAMIALAVLGLVALITDSSRALANTIDVTVDGVRSSRGQILIALHDTPASFTSRWSGAVATLRVPAGQRPVVVTFRDVPPGIYALIAVHDEDDDGQMTKSLIGFPQEGFGTSNNPGFLGPPRFRAARFTLDSPARIAIRMVYP